MAAQRTSERDLYSILGVDSAATPDQVRDAYLSRAKVSHPDRFDKDRQSHEWKIANEMLRELNDAYAILRDVRRRKDYDQRRSKGQPTEPPLTEKQPKNSAEPSVKASGNFRQERPFGDVQGEFDFPLNDATYRFPVRRRSNPFLFPMIVIGGGIGILGGYGALVLIRAIPEMSVTTTIVQPKSIVPSPPVEDRLAEPPRRRQVIRPESVHVPANDITDAPALPTTDATTDARDSTSEKVAVTANSPKSQVIKLRLDSTSQREQVTIPGAIRVARVEGAEASMSPASGIIAASPLEITINGPRPGMLSMSVVKIKDERYIQIVPTIKTDGGKLIPFTPKNLRTILMRTTKSERNAADLAASQLAEKNRLQAYVDSPGNRPLSTYKNAVARIQELGVQIPENQQLATSLDLEVTATQELAKFADQLQQSCSIEIESANATAE